MGQFQCFVTVFFQYHDLTPGVTALTGLKVVFIGQKPIWNKKRSVSGHDVTTNGSSGHSIFPVPDAPDVPELFFFPLFFSRYIRSTVTSAGVTPEIRDACPIEEGRNALSF